MSVFLASVFSKNYTHIIVAGNMNNNYKIEMSEEKKSRLQVYQSYIHM